MTNNPNGLTSQTIMDQQSLPLQPWRLLITPPTDGATNMAIDEAILQTLASGESIPTLRFYQWNPPCLSLGYGQKSKDVDQAACEKLGYTWVRRATGGRAILHMDELTYSIITRDDAPRVKGSIIESYRALSQGLLAGLTHLGADAVEAKGKRKGRPESGGAACFDMPSHYEVTLNDKKLVGSAQVRRRGIVLQHGTLPLRGDITRIFQVLSYSPERKARLTRILLDRATTLEAELGRVVSFQEAVTAMSSGFSQILNIRLETGTLTDLEQAAVDRLRTEQYANPAWNARL
ncbi:MAG: biotin/lipoate A/B protein ligase family protein [Chloroflexota bacterium]